MTLEQKIDNLIDAIQKLDISASEIMTVEEAARFLRRKPSTIRSWIAAKQIPFYKCCGSIYFLKTDLLAWVRKGRIKTQMEQLSESITR